jgi:hypothetical protein
MYVFLVNKHNFDIREIKKSVLDFSSNDLPSIGICLLETLDDIKEDFIHSPNDLNGLTCSKTILVLETKNR